MSARDGGLGGGRRLLPRIARWMPRAVYGYFCLSILGYFGQVAALAADTSLTREHQIKAAIVYKLSRYVDWPSDSFASSTAPFSLCMLGDGAFASALFASEKFSVDGHPIRFRTIKDLSKGVDGCHLLFIPEGRGRATIKQLAALAPKGLLTVGDSPGFARAGGMIGLVESNQRIQFEINPRQARAAHLRIGAQLLDLATLVGDQ